MDPAEVDTKVSRGAAGAGPVPNGPDGSPVPGGPGYDPSKDIRVTEWTAARGVIATMDTNIATTRQYGITFVAGLLTAQGLIEFSSSATASVTPPLVRFAIVLGSFAVLAAVFASDWHFQKVQDGAIKDALKLERSLRMHLTESVDAGEFHSGYLLSTMMYIFLAAAIGGLGAAVTFGGGFDRSLLTVIDIVVAVAFASVVFAIPTITTKLRRRGRDRLERLRAT